MEEKTFYKILKEINLNPKKSRQALTDKRLSLSEKKIIEAYFLVRDNKNEEATDILHDIPSSPSPFVEAQKKLLLGISLNNKSKYLEAAASLESAFKQFEVLKTPYFSFVALFNLSFIYFNLKESKKLNLTIQKMHHIPLETKLQEMRLLRCQFLASYLANETESALGYLGKIKTFKSELPESDIISQLVCEFMFFVKLEKFEMCQKTLNEMKLYRKFHLTENYNFMKVLLSHVVNNTPLYVYDNDFTKVPILLNELKVIQSFEENNREAAKNYWQKLSASLPHIYQSDFRFQGEKCLFSIALYEHLSKHDTVANLVTKEDANLTEKLVQILSNSKAPLGKELIYELLWGEHAESKDDFKKLVRLISKIRNEKGIEIVSRKGTYFISGDHKNKKIG